MKFIGWEVSEKLGYEVGRLYVNHYKRAKYARPDEAGIVCASLPTHLFDKCIAEPSLMTKISVGKYVDHLPVDRQFKASSEKESTYLLQQPMIGSSYAPHA